MSAPVFLADTLAGAASGGQVTIYGPEAHHAVTVMRLRIGEAVEIVDGLGTRATGTVADVAKAALVIDVDAITAETPPQPRIVVAQALAKGDRGERAVETLTEVGVDVIVPWAAQHSVSVWKGDKAERGVDKWRTTARTAAKQARRAFVPDVLDVVGIDGLMRMVSNSALALVLDEGAARPLTDFVVPVLGDVILIVGPEGGIAQREREMLTGAGAASARLGPSVLRTSTAGTVAAGILLSATQRWQGSLAGGASGGSSG